MSDKDTKGEPRRVMASACVARTEAVEVLVLLPGFQWMESLLLFYFLVVSFPIFEQN